VEYVNTTKWAIFSLKKNHGYFDTEEQAIEVFNQIKKRNPKIKRLRIQQTNIG
jgi:UDP-N-acetyl-D-mannosaminuronic acid transferase (WecB/TagA/CpsF family)